MNLVLRNISLPLSNFTLAIDVELRCQVTGLFGPSGVGKTSLLDVIAGLRRPTSARIVLEEKVLTDTDGRIFLPPRQREIGYVPQDVALFPHLSVLKNLVYSRRKAGQPQALFEFDHVIEVLELQPLITRGVKDLSGGEKQRVALGRALLAAPRLLLLDEPLASLDATLKAKIIPYLCRVRDEFHVPMIYVSHDAEEVQTLCDEVLEMRSGQITGRKV